MRVDSVVNYNFQKYPKTQQKMAVAFCADNQEEKIQKTTKNKVKDFLIDLCIAWTVIDIGSAIWKYFSNRGPKV